MINCPKCDAENQIGAIFCRGCGEKLELDELKPDAIRSAAKQQVGSAFNFFNWIKNGVMLCILAGGALVLLGLFLEPSLPMDMELTAREKKDAVAKLKKFQIGRTNTIVWSQAEVNYMATHFLGLSEQELEKTKTRVLEEGNHGMMTRRFFIEFIDGNDVRMVMDQRHTGKDYIRYYSVLEGTVGAGGAGMEFTPSGHAQGKVPMNLAGGIREIVFKRFQNELAGKDELNNLINSIHKIEISGGKVKLTGKSQSGASKKSSRRRR